MRSKLIMALLLSTVSGVALAQTTAPSSTMPSKNAAPMNDKATPHKPMSGGAMNNKTMDNKTMDQKADSTATDASNDSTVGLKVADTATVAVKYVSVSPADFTASKLIGLTVYNNQQESIGEIEDLVVNNGQKLTGVIVSVGGFIGIGESYVVLDPSTIVLNEKDGDWRAFVDTSKESLKGAPKFKYPEDKG